MAIRSGKNPHLGLWTPKGVVVPGGGGSSAFDPSTITGLVAWYDFSDPTTLFTDAGTTAVANNGDKIYQVNDKSGNANHVVQATLANRPTYSTAQQNALSAATFPADAQYWTMATFGGITQRDIIIFAGMRGTTAGDRHFIDGGTQRQAMPSPGGGALWGFYSSAGGLHQSAVGNNTSNHIWVVDYNGASSAMWIDGGAKLLGPLTDAGSSLTGTLFIGGASDGLGALIGTKLYEVFLIHDNAFTTAALDDIGNYLSSKWSLTWSAAQ